MHLAQIRALVRWDGSTEDIVLELGVDGNPSEAAWFLPVPARATLKLADAKLFDALQEFTKPEVRVEQVITDGTAGGAAGATGGAPPVTLLERRALGPFDVSTLAASDADALGEWLQTHGYNVPEGLAPVIQPYVEQGWYYIAVRLRPGQGEKLTGKLDPLWVTFPSDRIIYPVRVMQLAELPHTERFLPLFLYVLADHRVEPPEAMVKVASRYFAPGPGDAGFRASLVKFAGWVDPATLAADSPLVDLVPRRSFLTKFQLYIENPSKIEDDFVFAFAAQDTPYREIEIRYEYVMQQPVTHQPVEPTGFGTWVLLIIGTVSVGLLALGYILKRL